MLHRVWRSPAQHPLSRSHISSVRAVYLWRPHQRFDRGHHIRQAGQTEEAVSALAVQVTFFVQGVVRSLLRPLNFYCLPNKEVFYLDKTHSNDTLQS